MLVKISKRIKIGMGFYLFSIMLIKVISVHSATPKPDLEKYPHYFNLINMAEESVKNCYEDDMKKLPIKITDDGFQGLLKSSKDPPRNSKCLRYCMMTKYHLLNDSYQLNTPELLVFMKKLYNGIIDENLIKDLATVCRNIVVGETDRCERAHKMAMCIIGNINTHNIENI